MTVFLLLLTAAIVAGLLAVLARRRPTRRQRAFRQVLDAADALESRLRAARTEIEAVAGDQRDDDPIGMALREMLRQRVWLRDCGEDASLQQLEEVRASIDAARGRIEQQLSRIEQARQVELP